ncbi:aspartate racemase [Hahella sp. CCB-MM4]|nr:aspartate racemase [Hahella sp. CCB-MM4]
MGPLATVDFMQKIINSTPAQKDQDHLPLMAYSIPQIPDRSACLLKHQASPLPALIKGVNTLTTAGVGCIAIPCNTAHYWYPALVESTSTPILHIARACAEALHAEQIRTVALLATDGTLKAGIYSEYLAHYGIALEIPSPTVQNRVMEGIYRVKAGHIQKGGEILESCMAEMLNGPAEKVILGCTEIPLALDRIHSELRPFSMDATNALATACIQWYQSLAGSTEGNINLSRVG